LSVGGASVLQRSVRHQGFAYNLTYRGLTYRVDPNIEPAEVSAPPVAYQLVYRGVAYFVEKMHTGEVSALQYSLNLLTL
jgi:hypothetical protein